MKNSQLVFILICLTNFSFAQEKYFRIHYSNSSNSDFSTIEGKADSAAFVLKTQRAKNLIMADGYLLANIDQLSFAADTMQAELFVGEQYQWLALGTKNIPEEMLSKVGYRQQDFVQRSFSRRTFSKLISKLLDHKCEFHSDMYRLRTRRNHNCLSRRS